MELFGADIGPLAAIGCVTAYLFSGHAGIYRAQRVGHRKHHRQGQGGGALRGQSEDASG